MLTVLLITAVLLCLMAPPAPRRGFKINDLSRWEQYGGTLKRPPPPPPSRARS